MRRHPVRGSPERQSRDLGGEAARGTRIVPPSHPGPSTHARDDRPYDRMLPVKSGLIARCAADNVGIADRRLVDDLRI